MVTTIKERLNEDYRRSMLWYLLYDSDYQLSKPMIQQCFELQGKSVSMDEVKTHAHWLSEQSLTNVTNNGGIVSVSLTDRGLDVAKGLVNAVGVRKLRPSEISEIKAFLAGG